MKEVRYGIIGLGSQGSYYIKSFFEKGEVKGGIITALCDNNPLKIDAIKGEVKSPVSYFTDYKEMLDSGLCDAVIVVTPHYAHPEIVIEALNRGIHVICDKPAGVYTKQVREMNEVAEKSNAKFCMMFNQRTNYLYRKMRSLIQEGVIGEIQRVTWIITDWYRTQFYYNSGSWRATWKGEGGGVLINQCPHQLDLVQWICGLPKRVTSFCSYGKWHDIEVEDDVTAFFEYENGATGVFITTTGEFPGTNRFEISGTKGKLLCENATVKFFRNEKDSTVYSREATSFAWPTSEEVEVELDGYNPQHLGIINEFTRSILEDTPSPVDGREGINGVMLMNAIELSSWLGNKPVTLPVDEELYIKELNERVAKSTVVKEDKVVILDTAGTFESKKR